MAGTSTPQNVQQPASQPTVFVAPVQMSNPHDNNDVNAPFLVNANDTGAIIEGNHNDPEISVQKTAFNLNNANVRLTLWYIIYIIFTSGTIQTWTSEYIYYTDDHPEYTKNEDEKKYSSLHVSTNTILWWAAVIVLCSLYCTFCKCKCNVLSAILFIIGGIMQGVTVGDGISIDCVEQPYHETNEADIGYCKVSYIAGWIFIILFSFYLAVDTVYHIGNNIRIRILIKAMILAIQSFLEFLVWQYLVGKLNDNKDTDTNSSHQQKYILNTKASCNFAIFFWCLVLMIIIAMGYGLNPQRKLNIWVRRIIAWFLIGAVGGTLLIWFYYPGFTVISGSHSYNIPAAVLLIYDTQYI